MTIRITERALPGIGRCYEVPVESDLLLLVSMLDRGGCELAVRRRDADTVDVAIPLNEEETLALAAILTGAKLSIERDEASGLDAEGS